MTTVLPQKPEGTYTFASQPRAVPQRKKYRAEIHQPPAPENEGPTIHGNIMYDRRIVRGNTYAQHTIPASAQPDPVEIQRQQEARRRALARKRAKQQLRPKSPEAVEGRKHIDVQTELYLEELSDRVEEADVECQTDAFLDRPPSPMFVPAKTGSDRATQILEGDLFDFDVEVKPILEVMVGKTVEQALLEVLEEEELANLRAQQRAFEELRNAELVEQQRLEEQERRHREEKERRMKQQREILRKERETADKIAARAFAQSYLSDLVPSVFGTLADNGYFYDPVERDVEQNFMPWLMDRVEDHLTKVVNGRTILDRLLRQVVQTRLEQHRQLEEELAQTMEESNRRPTLTEMEMPPEPQPELLLLQSENTVDTGGESTEQTKEEDQTTEGEAESEKHTEDEPGEDE